MQLYQPKFFNMRKLLLTLIVLLASCSMVLAQNRVSGTVSGPDSNPLPGITIQVEGTNTGTATDANGHYEVSVPANATLIFRGIGFKEQEVAVRSRPTVNVTMEASIQSLNELVVTGAFGIKRSQRVTAYSSQVISEKQLDVIPHRSVTDALAGKIAGVQFRGQSPIKLNSEGALRIRGGQSLGTVSPIYVVDGTIVNSFDLNPDDIANITVLKGANATALFGGQAVNGAIVITTKVASGKGIGLQVNQSLSFDKIYILPDYQNIYAGGGVGELTTFHYKPGMPEGWKALDGKGYPDYTDDASWGPKMEGQEYIPWYAWFPGTKYSFKTAKLTPKPNNVRDFYNTGVTSNSNVAFGKKGDNYNFRISYTNQAVKGMIPGSGLNKNTFFASASYNLSNHFTAGTHINYTSNRIKGEFNDDYSNFSSGSFNQWFHRDLDMNIEKELKGLLSPLGTLASWNLSTNPNGYDPSNPAGFWLANFWYNPFSYFDNINYGTHRDRLFGDVHLTYTLNTNFDITATIRKNQLTTSYENIIGSIIEKSASQTGVLASYDTRETNSQQYTYELLANFQKEFNNGINLHIHGGGTVFTTSYKELRMQTQQGLNLPDLYAITNSKAQPSVNDVREKSAIRSLFASGDIGYKQILNLNFALRNDWYSTLPESDNSLLSPALGLTFNFSELTQQSLPWLSFGKVFGSWGRKPLALDIFQNNLVYYMNQYSWNGNFLMETPNSVPDSSLKGSLITTFEAGLDLRFVNNRYGIQATFYHELNDKAPIPVSVDGVSGYTSRVINAASIERTGLEFVLSAEPINTPNFTWDINKTFSYLISNKVKNLYGDQDRYLFSNVAFSSAYFGVNVYHVKGKDWGQMIGGGAKKTEDGQPLYQVVRDDDGNPVEAYNIIDVDKDWGSIVPKINGGLYNSLRYKDFILSFSLDYQVGGKYFSLDEVWGEYSGLLATTAATNDRGHNVREPVSEGGGVHIKGVDAKDNKPVDFYMEGQDYFHGFLQASAERYIHDLTYVKLRELSLTYQLPLEKWGAKSWIQGASISLISRNPWLIYHKDKNFDPSEVTYNAGSEAQYPGTRSFGVELKLNF